MNIIDTILLKVLPYGLMLTYVGLASLLIQQGHIVSGLWLLLMTTAVTLYLAKLNREDALERARLEN